MDTSGPYAAELISERMSKHSYNPDGTLWLLHWPSSDKFSEGNLKIMVDVTPEKRYAVWDHKAQRFSLSNWCHGFRTSTEAEISLNNLCNERGLDPKNYYVVEWEIKDNV